MPGYFSNFKKIYYDLSGSSNPNPIVVTNLLQKAKIIDAIKNNALVYYTYSVKDTDTPEIIAHKYYGDSNRHWIILLTNNIVDPYYDWVLPSNVFDKYITNKYGTVATAKAQVHHYSKTIEQTDSVTRVTTTTKYIIDQTTYTSLPSSTVESINLSDGSTVHKTTTKEIVYCYDYELDLNEKKRVIKILDKRYVGQLEKELKAIMNA